MSDARPIGVFDSGIGGLTVAKAIKKQLKNESIIYFGDAKHLPYGDKSPIAIQDFSRNITTFLKEQDCKAIVVACNTASSNAYKAIQDASEGLELVDVITPVADMVAFEIHQKIGVIATKATVESHLYKKFIKARNKHIQVVELATPLLVPIIEEGLINSEVSKSVVHHYLSQNKIQNLDALILGCTHYPLIEKEILKYYDNRVRIINSPEIVAYDLYQKLLKKDLLNSGEAPNQHRFYVSDLTPNFRKLATKIFGRNIDLELKTLH